MKLRNLVIAAVLWIALPTIAVCQDETRSVEDEHMLLRNPMNITLELTRRKPELNENPDNLTKPYTKGDRIYFKLRMTNNSNQPISILLANPYFQNRPELLKNGQKVPYRKEVAEKVKSVDQMTDISSHARVKVLEPYTPLEVGQINMSDWYDTLETGEYQLIHRFRFVVDGAWIESDTMTFVVQP
ncbi:MAG: hypothetical protein ACR2GW_01710 [Pyrinomonadaceae bacterium]